MDFMSPRETAGPASGPDADQQGDGRREGGSRTRRRLIETAQELLAEQGEDAIRLRELTAAAQVNVAAVHYHFGSLRALFEVAETEAVEYIVGAQLAELDALGAALDAMVRAFPDMHVHNDPYPVQFGAGDWTTVIGRVTGTFSGEMVLPDGTVIPGTGKSFEVDLTTTARWEEELMVEEWVFWDSALMAQQIGLA